MHRIMDKRIMSMTGNVWMNLKCVLKKYAGQIGYYACVALVLVAVAMAAERFRGGDAPQEQWVLPAVELAEPVWSEPEAKFELPEGMEIIHAYAAQPEWNHVHRQWETHAAVDFVCDGNEVRSFSEGVVRTVGKSGVYGGFVDVDADGIILHYCSIEPAEKMRPGEKLKKGDVIGWMDDSMPGENYMGKHLHLEVWESTNSRDIMDLIGKTSEP